MGTSVCCLLSFPVTFTFGMCKYEYIRINVLVSVTIESRAAVVAPIVEAASFNYVPALRCPGHMCRDEALYNIPY